MKTIEMKKVIQARGGLKNYSAITNIKWKYVRGIGASRWNMLDDIITFDYKGCKYRLESKYRFRRELSVWSRAEVFK